MTGYILEIPTRIYRRYVYEAHLMNFIECSGGILNTLNLPSDWSKLAGKNGKRLIDALLLNSVPGFEHAVIDEHTLEIWREDAVEWEDILPKLRHLMNHIYQVEVRESPWQVIVGLWIDRALKRKS